MKSIRSNLNKAEKIQMLLMLSVYLLCFLIEAVYSGWLWQSVMYGLGTVILAYVGRDVWWVSVSEFRTFSFDFLLIVGMLLAFLVLDYFDMSALLFIVACVILYYSSKKLAERLAEYVPDKN